MWKSGDRRRTLRLSPLHWARHFFQIYESTLLIFTRLRGHEERRLLILDTN